MNQSVGQRSLRLLASSGFAATPASQLTALSEWCSDFGAATADARYFVLSRIFEVISEAFGDAGVMERELYLKLDQALVRSLPSIIDERKVDLATSLARQLLDEVFSILRS